MKTNHMHLLAAASLLALGQAASAQAQGAPDGGQGASLEEVVVTAQRREERLQDVPVSITALSTAQIESKQIVDLTSLTKVAPGMAAQQAFVPSEIRVGIRGVTELVPVLSIDPAVGIYIDGVYHQTNAGSNFALIDMERVEVLKGPQGTLFGRNTIGGALNITTNKPVHAFEGYGQVDIAERGGRTYSAMVNAPIVADKLAARLVYQYAETDGFGRNTTLNIRTNDYVSTYLRGSVRAKLGDNWEAVLTGYSTRVTGTSMTKLTYVDTTRALIPGLPNNIAIPALSGRPADRLSNYIAGGYYDSQGSVYPNYKTEVSGGTATITGQLGGVTVKSITGFSDTYSNFAADGDGTPYSFIDIEDDPTTTKQFSEELQAYGTAMDDRLDWIVGAYYFHQTGSTIFNNAVLLPLLNQRSVAGPNVDNTSYAAFAQATYEIVPDLRLTAGVRYTRDDREVVWNDHREVYAGPNVFPGAFAICTLANAPGSTDPAACVYRGEAHYDYMPWTLGLDYKPNDDLLVYAKVSQGYRSGAFPLQGPAFTAGNAR